MKIIQVNAWLGRLNGPLKRFIESEQPDFICMQEAFLPNPNGMAVFADQYNFLDEIRQVSKLKHEYFAKNWGFTLGSELYDEGNVILSRYPLRNTRSVHTHNKYHIRNSNKEALPNTRILQSATASLPGGTSLSIANYQGYLDGPKGIGTDVTVKTMKSVREFLSELEHPLVFCGDLNIWPSSPALQELDSLELRNLTVEYDLSGTLSLAHRAPISDYSLAICDYILVSKVIEVRNFHASDELVSDHKALILEFDI